MNGASPLPVLLAHALLDLSRETDAAARDVGIPGSLLLWADLLRVIPGEGITASELPGAARISRRVVKAWLGLEKQGGSRSNAAKPGPRSCA